ncbi:MAG: hypothetical protein WCP07_08310 [bacterium]
MLRNKMGDMLQLGVALVILGVVVHLALALASVMLPLAHLAIFVGVVLAIIGLVGPGKKF